MSLLYEANASPCFSLNNAFFLVVKCIECSLSLFPGGVLGSGPGWGHYGGADGRWRENDALDNEIAFYQEIKTASK